MSSTHSFYAKLNELSFKEPHKIAEAINLAGDEWADADAIASGQEEQKKNYLARLIIEYLDTGGSAPSKPGATPRAMPVSQAEFRAQADPRYEDYVRNMVAARRKAVLAKVRYDMGKLYIEMQRSAMATKRQEMHTMGMHT